MKNKKLTPLMVCHLVMMVVLALLSVAAVVAVCSRAYALPRENNFAWKSAIYTSSIMSIFDMLALIAGIIYLAKGYSKQAAGFFKAFIALAALSGAVSIIVNIIFLRTGTVLDGTVIGSNGAYITRIVFQVCKIVLLLLLAFGKDLGKRRSWIFFGILLAIDVVLTVLSMKYTESVMVSVIKSLTHLLMTGTIGLAIKGKYDDKDARGTV